MPTISLTDYVDFVVASGEPKLTKVRQVKYREPYKKHFDHWGDLRNEIVNFHKDGALSKKHFDAFLQTVTEEKKLATYPSAVKNYQSFLGRKQITAADTERTQWKYKDLIVIVNPELKLTLGERTYLVKLYFKKPVLTKKSVDLIPVLMKSALPAIENGCGFAIVDLNHNKFYPTEVPKDSLLPLLYGEADSFLTIWKSLPSKPQT